MDAQALERIAKHTLRELGTGDVPVVVTAGPQPDHWRIDVGGSVQTTLRIRAGAGTSAQFVRDQIFDQFTQR
jgi:hypothetical protein